MTTTGESQNEREFDVIVYGATGFTGALVAEYLLGREGLEIDRWAVAGRNPVKLSELRARLSERSPKAKALTTIVADSADPESLRAMASRARVVLTTVGPYARYGEPLLRACVEAGSDYVDLTGEPDWWRAMIERYDAPARAKGLRLVPCCGFDSIPHDLGVWFTLQAFDPPLASGAASEAVHIDGYVTAKGGFSGGTWASALEHMGQIRKKSGKAKPSAAKGSSSGSKPRGPHRARDFGQRWVVPLPTIDPMVVRRSARSIDSYPADFRYHHYMGLKDLKMMVGLLGGVGAVMALAQFGPTRRLLERLRPSGAGPDAATREGNWFKVTFVARAGERRLVTRVAGGDPGYGETSKMIAESALCLAQDRDALPERAGILTPAAAMEGALVERLTRAGMSFSVVERD